MRITGVMVARDEELCAGMTVETARKSVNDIVLVDNMSTDNTVKTVRDACVKFGINLHVIQAPLTDTLDQLRMKCLNEAKKKFNPDWFLNMDADTVYNCDKVNLRGIAERSSYEQIWFRTLNLYGDIKNHRIGGLNIPHLWMFRNLKTIQVAGNYICPYHSVDPNKDRLIGWNLNGIKWEEHIFWRYQLWHVRKYNQLHKSNLGIDEYIRQAFTAMHPGTGRPTDFYRKAYVLNRLRIQCLKPNLTAAVLKLPTDEFIRQYMDYPEPLKSWKCPFELIFDGDGNQVIGRKPDLIGVPILTNEELWQLHPKTIGRDPWAFPNNEEQRKWAEANLKK